MNKIKKYNLLMILGVIIIIIFILIKIFFKIDNFVYIESIDNNNEKYYSKLNTSDEYKEYCSNNINNNDDNRNHICKMINGDFFNKYFYWECIAIRDDDINKCNLLGNNENKIYCKNNFLVYKAIINKDYKYCNDILLNNNLWHTNLKNIEFCQSAVWIVKKGNLENDIDIFNKDFFWEQRFLPRVKWVIKQDPKYCFDNKWIDDKIKCLIYNKAVKCDKLGDKDYIYKLINNTNHFYDN